MLNRLRLYRKVRVRNFKLYGYIAPYNMGAQTRKSWVHSPTQHGHISPCVFIACPTGLGQFNPKKMKVGRMPVQEKGMASFRQKTRDKKHTRTYAFYRVLKELQARRSNSARPWQCGYEKCTSVCTFQREFRQAYACRNIGYVQRSRPCMKTVRPARFSTRVFLTENIACRNGKKVCFEERETMVAAQMGFRARKKFCTSEARKPFCGTGSHLCPEVSSLP